ncbi:MFS transporter [Niallia circulans]|jgi:predicted MFS family arabinose efflux permease|uniref:MFS transporter n=1 Tax=Niallia circulans TaxID=1397 RepID=UPI000BA5967D|nr:MFS transporter [Niallia circulans]PAD23672.1 MFS transporter [Niallia circulans]PAD85952.1 MFS transporter [Niallia circulans]
MNKEKSFWSKNFTLLLLSNALLFLAFEMLVPTLPLLVESIGSGPSQVGMTIGIFTLSALVARPFCYALTFYLDKKYLLIIGVLITFLSTWGYLLSTNLTSLIVLRLVHGFGFGIATTFFATLASEQLPHNRMGEGIGYFGVGETISMSIGPMIGIALLNKYDFDGLFTSGAAILFIAVLLVFGITRKRMNITPIRDNASKKITYKLFKKKVLPQSLLIFFIGLVVSGVITYISLFAKHQGITNVAWFFFISALTGILIRVASGKIFDKKGPSYVLIPSGISLIIGIVLVANSYSELLLNIAGIFYGVAFGAIFPAIQAWVLNIVEPRDREDAMSTFYNCFDIGIGVGAMLLGLVVQATSYKTMFLLSTIFVIAFMSLTIYLGRNSKAHASQNS